MPKKATDKEYLTTQFKNFLDKKVKPLINKVDNNLSDLGLYVKDGVVMDRWEESEE